MREFGFVRVGVARSLIDVGNIDHNVLNIQKLWDNGYEEHCDFIVFTELTLTGYTCGDLFYQEIITSATHRALLTLAKYSEGKKDMPYIVVGAPLEYNDALYNCAVIMGKGKILGIVPKSYTPNTKEFYESRWFSSGLYIKESQIQVGSQSIPFGTDLLFCSPECSFGVEVCEDLWAPIPPSSKLALGGAHLILNPSASTQLVGKRERRKVLLKSHSARLCVGYAYAPSGIGESTTDVLFDGKSSIVENGNLIAEGNDFIQKPELCIGDIDIALLKYERKRSSSFRTAQNQWLYSVEKSLQKIEISLPVHGISLDEYKLHRPVSPHPFIAGTDALREQQCRDIINIQTHALATRLRKIGEPKLVIGLSGGLDSTLALLVVLRAMALLNRPIEDILCYTLPGFGTSVRTINNVKELCKNLNLSLDEVDITAICNQQLEQLSWDKTSQDVAFENVQARQRTAFLMNKANIAGGIVIGTGDLSELALGWCTYNGDQMSMYSINSGVAKTLIPHLIRHCSYYEEFSLAKKVLQDIIDTPISPELLSPDTEGEITQKTEELIGPYELNDFFLYNNLVYGYTPEKIGFLAQKVFSKKYSHQEIKKWETLFFKRFFSQQFKRSAMPDGPKVGEISLSPRGDWRMPSDGSSALWVSRLQ